MGAWRFSVSALKVPTAVTWALADVTVKARRQSRSSFFME
jgi:hypothetical protein